MALKLKANKRPFKNCKMLKMWKMTDEEEETYSETAIDFTKRLTTYTDDTTSNTTPLYGDGEDVEDAVSIGNGALQLGIHHLLDDERAEIYGEELNESGVVISTGKEIPPFFCVALAAEKRNGMLNLRKWFKTVFTPHSETVTQQENNGVTYSMPTLNGSYSVNTHLGMRVARVEVDPTTTEGQAFIDNWYRSAAFVGENT